MTMLISVDVEADGPCPGLYSMVCFGAVVVEPALDRTFYGRVKPITDWHQPETLKVSGFTREQHEGFDSPDKVMHEFARWLKSISDQRCTFISDNPAFDWQWINYYFWKFCGSNPMGFSARRIGDLYCGLVRNMSMNHKWKKLYRKTKHTHNPVDDARGNAEALLAMHQQLGLRGRFG